MICLVLREHFSQGFINAKLPRDHIGIQLFTVRDQVAALGFEAVFAELAEIGYREIEFAGYVAQGRRWSNQELRRLLLDPDGAPVLQRAQRS